MSKRQSSGQRAALELLHEAHDLVRGPLRTAIAAAIDVGEAGPRADLTVAHYDALKPGQKLVDPRRAGLLMRYGRRDGRRWFWRTSHPETGKQLEVPIGAYPRTGLSEARRLREELVQARSDGIALTDENGAVRHASAILGLRAGEDVLTVGALVRRYLIEYARKVKRSWQGDERLLERYLLADHAETPVADLTAAELTAIIARVHAHAPREAEKLRACLSTLFRVARGRTRKVLITKPWLPVGIDPMADVPLLPRREIQSYAPNGTEMRRLAGNLAQLDELYADAVRLQMETCARVSEVAELPWAEIDLAERVWTLAPERSKNGLAHRVMLSRQSVELLERRGAADPESAYVFPSRKHVGAPMAPDTVMRVIAANREALGVGDGFTSHSIRHGCLTWMAEAGIDRETRDRVSNHKPPSTSVDAIYTWSAERAEPARRALQRWCDFLDGAAGAKVVPIGGAS